jgi:hypothetical protein
MVHSVNTTPLVGQPPLFWMASQVLLGPHALVSGGGPMHACGSAAQSGGAHLLGSGIGAPAGIGLQAWGFQDTWPCASSSASSEQYSFDASQLVVPQVAAAF